MSPTRLRGARAFACLLGRLLALGVAACGGANGPVDVSNGTSQGFLTALIGASPFSASRALKATLVDSTLTVTGDDVYARQVSFTVRPVRIGATDLPRTFVVGATTLEGTGFARYADGGVYASYYWTVYPGGSGAVTITVLNAAKVEGTFSFTGVIAPEFGDPYNLRHISEGAFSVRF